MRRTDLPRVYDDPYKIIRFFLLRSVGGNPVRTASDTDDVLPKIIFDMTTVAALVEEHPILLFMTSSS